MLIIDRPNRLTLPWYCSNRLQSAALIIPHHPILSGLGKSGHVHCFNLDRKSLYEYHKVEKSDVPLRLYLYKSIVRTAKNMSG